MRLLSICCRQLTSLRTLHVSRCLHEVPKSSSTPENSTETTDELTRELYFDSQVVRLVLNSPKRRNALSLSLMEQLYRELEGIDSVQKLRAVILAGEGPAFSAGHDLRELTGEKGVDTHKKVFAQCVRLMHLIQRMQLPVIAEVEGVAAAAGCQLVSSCDMVVASEKATFAVPGLKVGLFCSTPGIPLVRNVPRKLAMDMLLTARSINAEEALRAGLVSRIAPPGEARLVALNVAEEILKMSRSVTALGKTFFYAQSEMSMAEAYRFGESVMCENLKLADAQEGIGSFVSKKQPTWSHRNDKVL